MRTCIMCCHLNGCQLLTDNRKFIPELVITEDNYRDCPGWGAVGLREASNRLYAFKRFGLGAVKGIHKINQLVLEDKEVEKGMDTVDVRTLLYEGITDNERADQLRFLTDEGGNFLEDDDGRRIPRSSFRLREYAVDPEGPVGESDKVRFWTADQLIQEIVSAEVKAGLVTRKKKGKSSTTKTTKPEEQESKMPKEVRKRVRVIGSKVKGAGAKKGGVPTKAGGSGVGAAAVRKPPMGGRRPPKPANSESTPEQESPKAEAPVENTAGQGALSNYLEQIGGAVEEVTKKLGSLDRRLKKMEDALGGVQERLDRNHQEGIECFTDMHDVMLQAAANLKEDAVFEVLSFDPETGEIPVREDEDGNSLRFDLEQNLLVPNEVDITVYRQGEDSGEE